MLNQVRRCWRPPSPQGLWMLSMKLGSASLRQSRHFQRCGSMRLQEMPARSISEWNLTNCSMGKFMFDFEAPIILFNRWFIFPEIYLPFSTLYRFQIVQQEVDDEDWIDLCTCWTDRKLSFFYDSPYFWYFQRSAADVNIGTMSFSFSQALISETCPLTQPMGSDGQSQVKDYQKSYLERQLLQYHADANSTW